jgi:mono/diheme cytochrome c family protein
MRNFVLGIIVSFLLLGLGGLLFAGFGLMPTNADSSPPSLERRVATSALNVAMNRRAPHLSNPVSSSDENLIEGMKIYTMNCAVCHGTLDNQPSPLGNSFYPPVPQLLLDPVDAPQWRTYYVVRNGIRYTGMPSWRHTLSEQDMWKVTTFLSQVRALPPAVQSYWSKSYGVLPLTSTNGRNQPQ